MTNVDTALVTATWGWDGGTQLDPRTYMPATVGGLVQNTSGYDQLLSPKDKLVIPYGSASGSYTDVTWGSGSLAWRADNAIPVENGSPVSIVTGINFSLQIPAYSNFYIEFPFNDFHYTGQDGCSISITPYSGGVIRRASTGSESLISYGGVAGTTVNITGAQETDTGGVILYTWIKAVYVKASKTLYLKKYLKPYSNTLNTPDLVVSGSRLAVFALSTDTVDYENEVRVVGTEIICNNYQAVYGNEITYPGYMEDYTLPWSGWTTPPPGVSYYYYYDILLGWQYDSYWDPTQWMANFQKIMEEKPELAYIVTEQQYENVYEEYLTYAVTMYDCDYLQQKFQQIQDPFNPTIYNTFPDGGFTPVNGSSVDNDSGFIGDTYTDAGYIRGFFELYTNTWKFFIENQGTQEYPYKQIWTMPNNQSSAITLAMPITDYVVTTGTNTAYNVCWFKVELVPNPVQSYYANVTASVAASSVNPSTGENDALVSLVTFSATVPAQTATKSNIYVSKYATENVVFYVGVARGNMFAFSSSPDSWWGWADSSVNAATTKLTVTITTSPA